eukprot:TRINITY_DN1219_c0_g1_i15.p1 TRINITY_DN1219_c0_g1~~TRINITY_DN1219_c0_g1_i15.p1  ORF type:complete len:2106 (-),score=513.93 TRINITY_DN1219_c0_g1_i15:64-6129(-)
MLRWVAAAVLVAASAAASEAVVCEAVPTVFVGATNASIPIDLNVTLSNLPPLPSAAEVSKPFETFLQNNSIVCAPLPVRNVSDASECYQELLSVLARQSVIAQTRLALLPTGEAYCKIFNVDVAWDGASDNRSDHYVLGVHRLHVAHVLDIPLFGTETRFDLRKWSRTSLGFADARECGYALRVPAGSESGVDLSGCRGETAVVLAALKEIPQIDIATDVKLRYLAGCRDDEGADAECYAMDLDFKGENEPSWEQFGDLDEDTVKHQAHFLVGVSVALFVSSLVTFLARFKETAFSMREYFLGIPKADVFAATNYRAHEYLKVGYWRVYLWSWVVLVVFESAALGWGIGFLWFRLERTEPEEATYPFFGIVLLYIIFFVIALIFVAVYHIPGFGTWIGNNITDALWLILSPLRWICVVFIVTIQPLRRFPFFPWFARSILDLIIFILQSLLLVLYKLIPSGGKRTFFDWLLHGRKIETKNWATTPEDEKPLRNYIIEFETDADPDATRPEQLFLGLSKGRKPESDRFSWRNLKEIFPDEHSALLWLALPGFVLLALFFFLLPSILFGLYLDTVAVNIQAAKLFSAPFIMQLFLRAVLAWEASTYTEHIHSDFHQLAGCWAYLRGVETFKRELRELCYVSAKAFETIDDLELRGKLPEFKEVVIWTLVFHKYVEDVLFSEKNRQETNQGIPPAPLYADPLQDALGANKLQYPVPPHIESLWTVFSQPHRQNVLGMTKIFAALNQVLAPFSREDNPGEKPIDVWKRFPEKDRIISRLKGFFQQAFVNVGTSTGFDDFVRAIPKQQYFSEVKATARQDPYEELHNIFIPSRYFCSLFTTIGVPRVVEREKEHEAEECLPFIPYDSFAMMADLVQSLNKTSVFPEFQRHVSHNLRGIRPGRKNALRRVLELGSALVSVFSAAALFAFTTTVPDAFSGSDIYDNASFLVGLSVITIVLGFYANSTVAPISSDMKAMGLPHATLNAKQKIPSGGEEFERSIKRQIEQYNIGSLSIRLFQNLFLHIVSYDVEVPSVFAPLTSLTTAKSLSKNMLAIGKYGTMLNLSWKFEQMHQHEAKPQKEFTKEIAAASLARLIETEILEIQRSHTPDKDQIQGTHTPDKDKKIEDFTRKLAAFLFKARAEIFAAQSQPGQSHQSNMTEEQSKRLFDHAFTPALRAVVRLAALHSLETYQESWNAAIKSIFDSGLTKEEIKRGSNKTRRAVVAAAELEERPDISQIERDLEQAVETQASPAVDKSTTKYLFKWSDINVSKLKKAVSTDLCSLFWEFVRPEPDETAIAWCLLNSAFARNQQKAPPEDSQPLATPSEAASGNQKTLEVSQEETSKPFKLNIPVFKLFDLQQLVEVASKEAHKWLFVPEPTDPRVFKEVCHQFPLKDGQLPFRAPIALDRGLLRQWFSENLRRNYFVNSSGVLIDEVAKKNCASSDALADQMARLFSIGLSDSRASPTQETLTQAIDAVKFFGDEAAALAQSLFETYFAETEQSLRKMAELVKPLTGGENNPYCPEIRGVLLRHMNKQPAEFQLTDAQAQQLQASLEPVIPWYFGSPLSLARVIAKAMRGGEVLLREILGVGAVVDELIEKLKSGDVHRKILENDKPTVTKIQKMVDSTPRLVKRVKDIRTIKPALNRAFEIFFRDQGVKDTEAKTLAGRILSVGTDAPPKQIGAMMLQAAGRRGPGDTAKDGGRKGTFNSGNQCYVSASMQALLHLRSLLLSGTPGSSAGEFASLFQQMWSEQPSKPLDLRRFKAACVAADAEFQRQFDNPDQQDAHEFLMKVIDLIGVRNVFEFHTTRKRTCPECKDEKGNTITHTIVPLGLTQGDTIFTTLRDCLRGFMAAGVADEPSVCDKCNKSVKKQWSKQHVQTLPTVFAIQLARHNARQKLTHAVEFPETLDLPTASNETEKYALVAVINHIGNTEKSGHYITHAFVENGWLRFDDEKVSPLRFYQVQKPENQNETPYVLFYQKRDEKHRVTQGDSHTQKQQQQQPEKQQQQKQQQQQQQDEDDGAGVGSL